MEKLVSILVPTFNRQELAIKAVKSGLAQTYKQVEIIVTDNSETDDLSNLLAKIGDTRIRYIKNKKNIGPILNWRKGLDSANGDYCLILPDDDYLINPFYIEDAVKILEDSDIDLIIPDCILSYPKKNTIGYSGYSGKIKGQNFIQKNLRIPHIGNIFRKKSAIRCNAFNTNDILWSDIELWMKLMSTCSVYCYNTPSALYLFHNENIVLNMSRNQLIKNSRYIRSSVESFASESLISQLVIRYLCQVDSITNAVNIDFINSILKINKLYDKRLYIFAKFTQKLVNRKIKTIIQTALKK